VIIPIWLNYCFLLALLGFAFAVIALIVTVIVVLISTLRG